MFALGITTYDDTESNQQSKIAKSTTKSTSLQANVKTTSEPIIESKKEKGPKISIYDTNRIENQRDFKMDIPVAGNE